LRVRGDLAAGRAGRLSAPKVPGRQLIVGGGIGGLTTAIALAKRGLSSTLLERSDLGEETGAGIQLGPNATRILRQLHVLDAVEAASFRPEAIWLFDAPSGQQLASMPLGSAIEERFGAPYLTLHRADFHASLLAACQGLSPIELREDFDVSDVQTVADGIVAKTLDGRVAEGSSLIAADGVWSGLRRRIAPNAELRFAGATAWRAILPRERVGAPFDAPVVGLWLGPRAHLVHYPVSGGRDVNVVAVVEDGSAEQGWNRQSDATALHAAFRPWARSARGLLDTVESWRCWSLYRLNPLPRWTDGRMALLGDAAHPVLPYLAQGAALAIEDAATLAAALVACGGDTLLAFPHYEALRQKRARRIQRQAARYGRLYRLNRPAALARNFILRRRQPQSLLRGFDWLYGPTLPGTA
jgi:2-polyprenyl-6-methoxyphenol hydroxylase-like FAD-dependent oxidoreductase